MSDRRPVEPYVYVNANGERIEPSMLRRESAEQRGSEPAPDEEVWVRGRFVTACREDPHSWRVELSSYSGVSIPAFNCRDVRRGHAEVCNGCTSRADVVVLIANALGEQRRQKPPVDEEDADALLSAIVLMPPDEAASSFLAREWPHPTEALAFVLAERRQKPLTHPARLVDACFAALDATRDAYPDDARPDWWRELSDALDLAEPEESLDAWKGGDDKPLPEDDAIEAAFPTRSKRHDLYAEAMRLVGARYSKGGLVALVNWLLHEREQRCAEPLPEAQAKILETYSDTFEKLASHASSKGEP